MVASDQVTADSGLSDPRGALRFIDPAKVVAAAGLVRDGQIFSLSLPLDTSFRGGKRPPFRRTVLLHNSLRPLRDGRYVVINDDAAEFALQGSSQWDGLAHVGCIDPGSTAVFYGGRGLSEVGRDAVPKTLGIENNLARGIASRGVVLDMVAFLGHADLGYLPGTAVNAEMVTSFLEEVGTELAPGDIVLLYTGAQRQYAANGDAWPERVPGFDGSTVRLWRDARISALVSDNPAVEAAPVDWSIHIGVLRDLGVVLGELWFLDELVDACRADGRYECMVASAPLNIPGAFGSPCNAIALR
jgi:kynurenine formamidase